MGIRKCNCQSSGSFTNADQTENLNFSICSSCGLDQSSLTFSINTPGFANFGFVAETFDFPVCGEGTLNVSGTGLATGQDIFGDVSGPASFTFSITPISSELVMTFSNGRTFSAGVSGFTVSTC